MVLFQIIYNDTGSENSMNRSSSSFKFRDHRSSGGVDDHCLSGSPNGCGIVRISSILLTVKTQGIRIPAAPVFSPDTIAAVAVLTMILPLTQTLIFTYAFKRNFHNMATTRTVVKTVTKKKVPCKHVQNRNTHYGTSCTSYSIGRGFRMV